MALKATEVAKSIETEGKIENLIKAKGFDDCMVYYADSGTSLIDLDDRDILHGNTRFLEDDVLHLCNLRCFQTVGLDHNIHTLGVIIQSADRKAAQLPDRLSDSRCVHHPLSQ